MKKVTAIFLAVTLILCFMPTSALAAGSGCALIISDQVSVSYQGEADKPVGSYFSDGPTVLSMADDGFNASAVASVPGGARVIIAVYNARGALVHLETSSLFTKSGSTSIFGYPLSLYKYKVFCWNAGFVPISDVFSAN